MERKALEEIASKNAPNTVAALRYLMILRLAYRRALIPQSSQAKTNKNLTKQPKGLDLRLPGCGMFEAGAQEVNLLLRRKPDFIVYFHADKRDRIRFLYSVQWKWLLGESRALKVGINAGSIALPFKNR